MSEGKGEKAIRHSRAYHDYFEDYAEKEVIENGKIKIERIYIGNWYCAKLSRQSRSRRKVIVLFMFLLLSCLFALSGLLPYAGPAQKVIGAMQGLTVVFLIFLGVSVVRYLLSKEQMTIHEYNVASVRLKQWALALAIILFALSGVTLSGGLGSVTSVGCSIISAVLAFGVFYLERSTEYDVLPPTNTRPEKSSAIRKYTSL